MPTETINNGIARLLELPDPIERKAKEKRPVKSPDLTLLKSEQKQAFDEMLSFIQADGSGMHALIGVAGTGKTFTMNMFIEYVLAVLRRPVAATATTNKAVKVMRDMGDFKDPNLDYMTTHSLLALKEQIDGYGRQKFVQVNREQCKIPDYFLILIDEVSQLNDDLFAILYPYLAQYRIKIIFIGDPCQIPPVNKAECIPLDPEKQREYKIGVSTLTEVQRQASDSPIIQVSMKIRNALGRPDVLPLRTSMYDPVTMDGAYFFSAADKPFVWEMLQTYFKSENFKINADFMKVIAWTNRTADTFNKLIRKMIYGEGIPRIMIGEKLIANRPILDDQDTSIIIFTNNDEFGVISYEIQTAEYREAPLTFYDTMVLHNGMNGPVKKRIRIIHDSSLDDFEVIKNYLKTEAIKLSEEKKGNWEAAQAWTDYRRFQEIFADVSYNYAITAHKAQGSTYRNCMVIENDMDFNKKVKERNRIKYTACTRPSHRLFIAG